MTAAAASPGPGRCRRVCRGPARALPARFPRATGGWSAGDTRRAEEPRPGHRQCATAVGTGTLCHGRACDEGERGSQKPRGPRLGRRRGRKARGPPTPPAGLIVRWPTCNPHQVSCRTRAEPVRPRAHSLPFKSPLTRSGQVVSCQPGWPAPQVTARHWRWQAAAAEQCLPLAVRIRPGPD